MVKNHKAKPGGIPADEPCLGDQARRLFFNGLRKQMESAGKHSTLILVPSGYREDDFERGSRKVHFDRRWNVEKQQFELFVPRDRLIQVSKLKHAIVDKQIFYLVSLGGDEFIVRRDYVADIKSEILGPFFKK